MKLLTHVSVCRFVSVALPRRTVRTWHGERRTHVITLYVAAVAGRMRVVTRVAAVAEVVYAHHSKHENNSHNSH